MLRRQEMIHRQRAAAAEAEKQRRAVFEYQRRLEEEHEAHYHLMAELERERQEREEDLRRQRCFFSSNASTRRGPMHASRGMTWPREEYTSDPMEKFVRGRDGRLYRVIHPRRYENENQSARCVDSLSDTMSFDKERECYDLSPDSRDSELMEEGGRAEKGHLSETVDDYHTMFNGRVAKSNHEMEHTPASNTSTSRLMRERLRSRNRNDNMMTAPIDVITVEDVPDEEDDELRELRSVWRNRVPSPGKWIEPVEVDSYGY